MRNFFGPRRYEHVTPPVVPRGAELIREAEIAELDEAAFLAKRRGELAEMDRLIDRALGERKKRPVRQVPVIPGRSS